MTPESNVVAASTSGGTRALRILVTMDDQQGADMVELIAPPVIIHVHYDDYKVFRPPCSTSSTKFARREVPMRFGR